MNNKLIKRTLAAVLIFLSICACNNESTQKQVNLQVGKIGDNDSIKILEARWDTLYDHLVHEMEGVAIADTIRHIVLLKFSNDGQPDSFELKVVPGLIARSKSELRVITADNRVIYSQVFATIYFARNIIEEHVPYSGGPGGIQKIEDLNKRISAFDTLSKTHIENEISASIKEVFKDMYITRQQVIDATGDGYIGDTVLYNEVIKPASGLKVISIPCFDCGEGDRFIAYSAMEKKAKDILSMD